VFLVRKKLGDLGFKIIIGVVALVIFASAIYYANDGFGLPYGGQDYYFETARVVEVLEADLEVSEDGFYIGEMLLVVEIETGSYRSRQIEVVYHLNQIADQTLAVDDRVSIQMSVADSVIMSIDIQNFERRSSVFAFFAVFLLILGILGGKRGIIAIMSLVFTLICIVFLLIPLMLRGYPVLLTTFIILALVTTVSLTFLAGLSSRGISAIIGCLFGIMTTAILTYLGGTVANISGFQMEEVGLILAATDFPHLQATGLFISGVLIASLGAVMSTAVTIASTIHELREKNKNMTVGRLFASGIKVGRQTMGAMVCTLVLAFAGMSLNMMIFTYSQGISVNQLINSDFIVIEIIRSIAGSLGIILTIPAVAFVSCVME